MVLLQCYVRRERAQALGLKPRAVIRSMAVAVMQQSWVMVQFQQLKSA